jgi:hypothetical protein
MFNEPSKKVLSQLPDYGTNNNTSLDDVVIYGHFFVGGCDWYVAEFDGEDTFWGFVNLNCPQNAEWGPFLLSELRNFRLWRPVVNERTRAVLGHLPVEVEWDKYWQTKPFGQIGWEK